jgi:DNA-binding CsgD family transcriptional regulator
VVEAVRVVERVWPLVGRGEELDELVGCLLGGDHAGVVVAGSAGVGKTRLAREVLNVAVAAGYNAEWVMATRAAASAPLSVFAALMPSETVLGTEPIDVFGRVAAALRARSAGRPTVVAVDDAQLLDDAAAALVLYLATSGAARLLVTVRSGVPTSDAVVALWKEGIATRLDLQPLAEAEVAQLTREVLGGQVEAATAERLHRVTGGNVLFLREVVDDLLRTDQLRDEGGVWRWVGELNPGPRLRELVSGRLARLSPAKRRVVELLAVGEPLGVPVLTELCGVAAVAAVEHDGLIVVEGAERRRDVRLAHPLYGEVLHAVLPTARRMDLARQLAASLTTRSRRAGDTLRLGLWSLEGDFAVGSETLTDAAVRANAVVEYASAERLARAALAEGGGYPAAVALGEALINQGRRDAALAVLAAPRAAPPDDATRARGAYWLALAIGDTAKAVAVLADAEAAVHETRWRDFLRVDRAAVLTLSGRMAEAAALAGSVVEDPTVDDIVRVRALTAIGGHWAISGESKRALAAAQALMQPALAMQSQLPRAPAWVFTVAFVALVNEARLDDADALLDRAAAARRPEYLSVLRGRICLLRGRAKSAAAHLREAVAALSHGDAYGWQPWALALLAEAEAQCGNTNAAQRAAAEAGATVDPKRPGIAHDAARATVWVAATRGELSLARSRALEVAKQCRLDGVFSTEIQALHDALRLDAPDVTARLVELATQMDGGWAPAFADHAVARTHDDAAALDRVVSAFEALGALRLAAEAAAEAAAAHRRSGHAARATAAATRAAILNDASEHAAIPVLDLGDAGLQTLSRREREIAMLARTGLSNREMAERLSVSVRTVEGHLYRLYTKLGVSDRDQLASLLVPPGENA